MADTDEIKLLEVHGVIAFDGTTLNALKCHPNGIHMVYPIGNKICVQNWKTKRMDFLAGHTNIISTLNVSPNGKYIGSGQINQMGFKALVILWDFNKRTILSKHEFHKVRVEYLIFSHDDQLMISIGGRDCGQIVVWQNDIKAMSCVLTASKVITGDAITLAAFNNRYNSFISAGDGNIRIWNVDPISKTPSVIDVPMGKLKRYILCVAIDKNDEYVYCGTTSGDIIKIHISYPTDPSEAPMKTPSVVGCYGKCGPWKKNAPRPELILYSFGVRCIIIRDNGSLIIGSGDGTVDIIEEVKWKKPLPKTKLFSATSPHFKSIRMKKLESMITSMEFKKTIKGQPKDVTLMIGTKMSEVFLIDVNTLEMTLAITCHNSAVNDVTFPTGISEVFATAGTGDIRVWCLRTCQELLRIQVSHFVCTKVLFAFDGKSIISGWSDGCIRSFKPLSGRLIYCILNTHIGGTSAIAVTKDGKTVISGGNEGQIRIWSVGTNTQTLMANLKEHKAPVSAIKINNLNTEVVSAGADGSCIIWDIINYCRRQILFAHTMFNCVCYEPTCCQILTGGTDKRIKYWDAGNGTLIRELEASQKTAVNAIHIDHTGEKFVSGGNDQILKLWKYNEGIYTHQGVGHSGAILSACFSPDGKYIVSSSISGCIFIWKCPQEPLIDEQKMKDIQEPVSAKSSKSCDKSYKIGSGRDENISTINTARSSIIAACPCTCKTIANDNKFKTGAVPKNKDFVCECKKVSKPPTPTTVCMPPVEPKDMFYY